MKDRFITNNFEIDLSNSKISVTEENPRFKDTFWTKYSLPFDVNLDRDFISKLGHYSSLFAKNLLRFHEGYHVFEGRVLKGKLEVLEIKGNTIKCQINSGFEELPNFDKKLSELPLQKLDIPNIYLHAEEICKKKFPETNYNFPKLITDEFDLESEGFKYFDGLINNRYLKNGTYIFPANEVINDEDVANRNIIHPLPYLLYLLQVGFLDAGFILEGDVLNDETLKQRTVYSGSKYYTTAEQKEFKEYVYDLDFTPYTGNNQTTFSKKIKINAPGKYRILGTFKMQAGDTLKIFKNNVQISPTYTGTNGSIALNQANNNTIITVISIDEALQGSELRFDFSGTAKNNDFDAEGKNIGIAQIQINPIRNHTAAGDPIPFVFNENRIDLTKAVPDMTFGDVVNFVKNLRNYDLVFDGEKVFMNLIKIDHSLDAVDFRGFEVEKPLRKFTDKQSFNIKFPETDLAIFDNIFFNENGYTLNGTGDKNTSEITINGFAVPLAIFRGTTTAKIAQENSVLQLVYYDGLKNGLNHAQNPNGLHGIYIAEHLKPWFVNRVTNIGFNWTFVTKKNKIRNVNIRSEIFCYGKRQWIKTMTKNQLTPEIYSIEINTEGMD